MATAVASRFAVLSIDDDDDAPKKSQPKKKTDSKKPGTATSAQTSASKKKNAKKNEAGKGNQQINTTSNKSKGKGSTKPEGNKDTSQKKKNPAAVQEQWDQWKKKDSELVDCTFEQEMTQAILLSKLDYEQKKDIYEQTRKAAEEEKKQGSKKSKKSNKLQTMSLEEFNTRHSESPVSEGDGCPLKDMSVQPDPEFFDRIKDDTKKVLTKEQEAEKRKAREPFIQETITVAQLEDRLEKRNQENKALREEVIKLKEELHNVKSRNKKLCNILALGEMKEKAEVLVEVEQLQRMRDELSSEVSSLHAQLEQERSKVRSLTTDTKGKSQNKKRSTSETNQA
ncbi:G kinase-anchoring protein 1 [Gryllus bimaculatus]|nr:G kinase-anchoring protein 1 [Gryllus bimaculatus]